MMMKLGWQEVVFSVYRLDKTKKSTDINLLTVATVDVDDVAMLEEDEHTY